jgi:hypothetical protein
MPHANEVPTHQIEPARDVLQAATEAMGQFEVKKLNSSKLGGYTSSSAIAVTLAPYPHAFTHEAVSASQKPAIFSSRIQATLVQYPALKANPSAALLLTNV